MLQVYFDESESQNPNDVFVLAGCVSTPERWPRFRDAWRERLHGIDYWHTTDWLRRDSPYDRLTDVDHATLALDLRGLVEDEDVLLCVMQVIPVDFYRRVFSRMLHQDAMRAYKTDAYFFCFLSCMGMLSDAQRDGRLPPGRIDSFFERRDRGHDRRLAREHDRVRQLKQFAPGQFGRALGGTKGDPQFVPCQAADLVAHGTMTFVRQKLFRPNEPVSIDLRAMNESGKLIGGQFADFEMWKQFIVNTRAHQAELDAMEPQAKASADGWISRA